MTDYNDPDEFSLDVLARGGPTDEMGGYVTDDIGGDEFDGDEFDGDDDFDGDEEGGDDYDGDEDGGDDYDGDEEGGDEDGGPRRNRSRRRGAARRGAQRRRGRKSANRAPRPGRRRVARGRSAGFGSPCSMNRPRGRSLNVNFGCGSTADRYYNSLSAGEGMTRYARPTAPFKKGVRLIALTNFDAQSLPVQLSARATARAVQTSLLMAGQAQPVTSAIATNSGGTGAVPAYKGYTVPTGQGLVVIDPIDVLGTSDFDATAAFPSTSTGKTMRVRFAAVRAIFGQPALSAAAGVPITFSIYTWTQMQTVQTGMSSATLPTAELSKEGTFNSGTFVCASRANTCIADVSMLTYEVVAGAPQPKACEISRTQVLQATGAGAVNNAYLHRGLALSAVGGVTSSSQLTLQALTPGTPDWNFLMSRLTRGC